VARYHIYKTNSDGSEDDLLGSRHDKNEAIKAANDIRLGAGEVAYVKDEESDDIVWKSNGVGKTTIPD